MNEVALKPEQALPRVSDGGEWVRKTKFSLTLNDQVEAIHMKLCDDEEYLRLLEAVHDSQAVEGSLSIDNTMAAERIRRQARKDHSPLGNEKLATISRSLNVVMRRYGVSRKDRRDMVGGQRVPSEDNGE